MDATADLFARIGAELAARPTCGRCGGPNDRHHLGQRRCRACHAEAMRAWRRHHRRAARTGTRT